MLAMLITKMKVGTKPRWRERYRLVKIAVWSKLQTASDT